MVASMLSCMSDPTPFFVAMPTRNAAASIAGALESVAAQDLTGISVHVHVQDGGSTDGTIEIVREWSARIAASPRAGRCVITWATAADGGMYDAIVTALGEAAEQAVTAGIFFWLNADDVLMPGALGNLATTFADPAVDWVIGAAVDLDEQGAVTLHTPHARIPDADLRAGNFNYTGGRWLRAESTAMRLSVARECGPFTAGLRLAGDYDLFVRLARRGPPTYVDYAVRGFRRHPGQLSEAMVAYQCECARVRCMLPIDAMAPTRPMRAGAGTTGTVVFYPDRRATDPYQDALYEGLEARGVATLDELSSVCRQTPPATIHVHWLDEIVDQERMLAAADARAFVQTVSAAQAGGHRIVFTLHEGSLRRPVHGDLAAGLVEFLFRRATLVHMHQPAVAADIRRRFAAFPWRRVVFAEAGPYRAPWALIERVGLMLVNAGREVVAVGDTAGLPAAFRARAAAGVGGLSATDADGMAAAIRHARWALLGPAAAFHPGLVFHILAAGTPVVVPRLGRMPAVVFDGINGMSYDPDDDASCRTVLEMALTECEKPVERAARERAMRSVAGYSWSTMRDMILRSLS